MNLEHGFLCTAMKNTKILSFFKKTDNKWLYRLRVILESNFNFDIFYFFVHVYSLVIALDHICEILNLKILDKGVLH